MVMKRERRGRMIEPPEDAEAAIRATLGTRAARGGYRALLASYGAEDMADLEAAIEAGDSPEPLRAFVAEHGLGWDLQWTRSTAEIVADDIARAVGHAVRARQIEGRAEECRRAALYDLAETTARQGEAVLMRGRQALWQALVALHGPEGARREMCETCDAAALARISERATRDLERREAEEWATA